MGKGDGAEDHKILYTWEVLEPMLASVGFDVKRLEYFDRSGTFHGSEWDPHLGMVRRSARFDPRNKSGELRYTSIIFDAMKPEEKRTIV